MSRHPPRLGVSWGASWLSKPQLSPAGGCVSQTSPAGRRVRGRQMDPFDPNRRVNNGTRRSERIANPHTKAKEQQNALSSLLPNPLREVASFRACDSRVQNTYTASTSPQSERKRQHEAVASQTSPKPPRKRTRLSHTLERQNFDQDQPNTSIESQSDRIHYWTEKGTWPPEPEDEAMKRFRENYVPGALAKRRSSGSLTADNISSSDQTSVSERNTYTDGQVVIDLKKFGSFMKNHKEGMAPESITLCLKLLSAPQKMPEGTLFSDDLFPGLCKMVQGQNEPTVVHYILPHLVPSPKIRALRGAKHLEILNETINASWINATECCDRRPKPNYSIAINREALSPDRLHKLRPFIVNQLNEESTINATYDTLFPFLTAEVTCGATALDIADRQNALSQTVGLRGLVTLFRLVRREQELHRKVLGFSISHDNQTVKIYGHYPFINGEHTTYHRCSITKFNILPTIVGDQRWTTATFVQNVQDLWAVEHFKMICSAVDDLQLDAESSPQPTRPLKRGILETDLCIDAADGLRIKA